jgi:hypothetical protein
MVLLLVEPVSPSPPPPLIGPDATHGDKFFWGLLRGLSRFRCLGSSMERQSALTFMDRGADADELALITVPTNLSPLPLTPTTYAFP